MPKVKKIWTIDQNNLNLALSSINLGADTERDIRNAVHAGKVVTTHEAQINFHGWIGEGYIILDPNTGAGAYMIAGGGNGAELTATDHLLAALKAIGLGAAIAVAALPFILFAAVAGFAALAILTSAILATAWVSAKTSLPVDSPWRTFFADIFSGVGLALLGGLIFGLTLGALLFVIAVSILYAILGNL